MSRSIVPEANRTPSIPRAGHPRHQADRIPVAARAVPQKCAL